MLATLAVVVALSPVARADEPKSPLAGTWLFDAAAQGKMDRIGLVWASKLTVTGNGFALSKFLGLPKDLTGTFTHDPAGNTIDLTLDELDVSAIGTKMVIPAGKHPGVYKLDGNRLTVCFTTEAGGTRPKAIDVVDDRVARLTLVRSPAGFTDFPKEVTLKVAGPDSKPAAGATVANFMSLRENREKKDAPRQWSYYQDTKTGTDGTVKLPYDKLSQGAVIVRDAEGKSMAFAAPSPAAVVGGELAVALKPECRVTGQIVCEELAKLGRGTGWTNVYLMANGRRLADCDSSEGKFEFVAPPGDYTLHAYGGDLQGKQVSFTVPANQSEFTAPPVALTATRLVLLQGQPAPEFEGVVGWSGKPVKLADLKGKYVLVDFWGYWCGPCIHAMPVLIELHEKFADKGLAVVGVHVDGDGEVDTAAKLEEKITGIRKELWKGKDLPFPSALTSGKRVGEGDDRKRGGTAAQYGITSYPTTVLIGPDGKVVGQFHARDIKSATAEVEKLLGEKK